MICLIGLSSCNSVIIKDQEWCTNLSDGSAYCATTLSGKKRVIEKDDWDKLRVGMLTTKAENYANLKEVIKQLCSQTNDCYFDNANKVLVIKLDGIKK